MKRWRGIIEEYRAHLPVTDKTPAVTLNEGGTPLIEAHWLSKQLGGGRRVFLKYEGLNPTGSFKDRGMTMAVSKAVEAGAKTVICASTGNTSASAAAYAARAGVRCAVVLPEASIARGKLVQAMMHGAKVIAIRGSFDDGLAIVRELGNAKGFAIVNSINPYRLEGQKTAAFEVCEQLGAPPTHHLLPVGNAGNITAYWKGYCEYFAAKKISSRPRMLGFQAAGAAPIVLGRVVEKPQTLATAIRIGNPASWKPAVAAANESGGFIDSVADEEIVVAYQLLAASEGVFVEPASAAGVAGLLKHAAKNYYPEGATIVITVTGHGLKDPEIAYEKATKPFSVEPTVDTVREAIGE